MKLEVFLVGEIYTKENDLRIGIDNFGKSAPFKELYNDFNISSSKIVSLIQKIIKIDNFKMNNLNFFQRKLMLLTKELL